MTAVEYRGIPMAGEGVAALGVGARYVPTSTVRSMSRYASIGRTSA